jgi:hypothetical protein
MYKQLVLVASLMARTSADTQLPGLDAGVCLSSGRQEGEVVGVVVISIVAVVVVVVEEVDAGK